MLWIQLKTTIMKKTKQYLFFLLIAILWTFTANVMAQVSFRTANFKNITNKDGTRSIQFDIVAQNTSEEKVILEIYDFSCTIMADLVCHNGGRPFVDRKSMSCTPRWSKPPKFDNMELEPDDRARSTVTVPFTMFKYNDGKIYWRWEGEQKSKDYYYQSIKVSNIKYKCDTKRMKTQKDKDKTIIIVK